MKAEGPKRRSEVVWELAAGASASVGPLGYLLVAIRLSTGRRVMHSERASTPRAAWELALDACHEAGFEPEVEALRTRGVDLLPREPHRAAGAALRAVAELRARPREPAGETLTRQYPYGWIATTTDLPFPGTLIKATSRGMLTIVIPLRTGGGRVKLVRRLHDPPAAWALGLEACLRCGYPDPVKAIRARGVEILPSTILGAASAALWAVSREPLPRS